MTTMPTFVLTRMSWPEVRSALKTVRLAIIPTGSCEQLGPNMTLETDAVICYALAERLHSPFIRGPCWIGAAWASWRPCSPAASKTPSTSPNVCAPGSLTSTSTATLGSRTSPFGGIGNAQRDRAHWWQIQSDGADGSENDVHSCQPIAATWTSSHWARRCCASALCPVSPSNRIA